MSLPKPKTLWKHWDTIEKKIEKEINWLENSIDTFSKEEKAAPKGVYKKGVRDLFIEVGTTSLFKLWINLKQRRNFTYLIIPNDDKLIEFTCS